MIKSENEKITIDGYNYDSLSPETLEIGTGENVINIYYTKRNDLSYTVNYIDKDTNKAIIDAKTESNQTFGTVIKSENEKITIDGYNYDSASSEKLTIGTGENVLNLYYTKRTDLSYTVNYYWNGTEIPVKPSKTVLHQTFGAEATESPIGADDYTPESNEPKKIKIGADSTQNVINFYYYRNVKLTANSDAVTYDGNDRSVFGFTGAPKEADFSAIQVSAMGKNFGTYPAAFAEGTVGTVDKTKKYIVTDATNGQLTINKRNVVLTSETASKPYDGKPLTKPEVQIEGSFVDGEVLGIVAQGKVTHVSEGEVTNTIFFNPGANFKESNYNIVKNEGKLWITGRTDEVVVEIEGRTKTVTYNGEEHTAWQYDVISISDPLYETAPGGVPNFWNKNAKKAKGTDAGTYPMGWEAADFENTNTNFSNVKFVVTDGQLVINPRPVVLTSGSDSKVYNGEALTKDEVTASTGENEGFVKDQGATYNVTGSQTDVGTSNNTFTYELNSNTKAGNYEITKTEGTLEVTPVTEEVIVTITGRTLETTYDGKEHDVFGYDATPSNALYRPNEDMWFDGADADMIAKGTDADTYPMGLEVSDFKNKSDNFTNVTFVVTDGYVKITPRAVTLTSETAGKTYDGTALTKPVVTVGGDGFVEGQVKEIKATGSVTNAGSVANTITFTPDKETFKESNYAITKNEGTLTIAKRSVLLTSQSATKTYDGSALTRPAVTITGDGFVPGELAKVEATGSITNVGSTPNAIQYTTTGAFNPANYSIALSVGTLTVTAKPEPEPRRTFNLTVNYVYQNGKRAAASYNRGGLKNGETFDITSPVIAGYTASETVVSGTIDNRDIKVTVIYTADGVNLDDYGVPLGLGNITMNVGDCFE